MIEKEVLIEMLQVEKEACHLVEDAKVQANKLLLTARKRVEKLTDETKKVLLKEKEGMWKNIQDEAEREIEKIALKTQKALVEIENKVEEKRGPACDRLGEFLFEEFIGSLRC